METEKPCRKCGEVKPLTEYYTNRATCKKCVALYYQENREQKLAYQREYDAEHRKEKSNRERKRRARKNQAMGTHTLKDEEMLRDSGFCVYCGRYTQEGQIDHVIPLSNAHSYDSLFNLAHACPSCNGSKSAIDPLIWIDRQGLDLDTIKFRYRWQHYLDSDALTPFD